jgi:hypothetical protein
MGLVFVIQDNGTKDFRKARRYGELVPVLWGDAFPDNSHQRVEEMQAIIRAKLRGFDPQRDYILLTGDPVAIAITALVISERVLTVRFLKWDRENREYYAIPVQIS